MKAARVAAARCENRDGDTLALSGALTFATAAQMFGDAGRALAASAQTRLDLAGVGDADSAGLACVLALAAEASRAGRRLAVLNLPENLRALADVCDARALLDMA